MNKNNSEFEMPDHPSSRTEEYLAFLTGTTSSYPLSPQSRVEAYLLYLCQQKGEGSAEIPDWVGHTNKILLEYDGTDILKPDGSVLLFDDLYSMLMETQEFVVLVYNNRAYHPNRVSTEQVVFVATYPSNGYIQSERITLLASGAVTTTFGEAEKTSSRVNAITDANKNAPDKYPSVKAVNDFIPRRGNVAVVLGDSYFDGGSIGYQFGDWLKNTGAYKEVYNYARGGTGFGNTYAVSEGSTTPAYGPSLYDFLNSVNKSDEIGTVLAKADTIYIHEGGNDLQSQLGFSNYIEENNLYEKVKACFNKLSELTNDKAIIYYVPPFKILDTAAMLNKPFKQFGNQKLEPIKALNTLERLYDIYCGVAESDANVVVYDGSMYEFVYKNEAGDLIHPTKENAEMAFDMILHGNYRPKTLECIIMTRVATSVERALRLFAKGLVRADSWMIQAEAGVTEVWAHTYPNTPSDYFPFCYRVYLYGFTYPQTGVSTVDMVSLRIDGNGQLSAVIDMIPATRVPLNIDDFTQGASLTRLDV